VVDKVVIINEGMNITEDVSTILSLTFELYYAPHISGAITDSNEITFTRGGSDSRSITAFVVKVRDPSKEKIKRGIELGDRTINYLSAITRSTVRSKRPKIEKRVGSTPQTSTTPLNNVDLDASKLPSLLSSERPVFNKRIDSYQSGLAALTDYDLEQAMAQFHQVIEESELKQEAEYYKPLRHACDHHRIDGSDTAKAIRNLGIKCTTGEPVDFTDPDNWQQLYVHIIAVKQLSDGYIRKILTDSNLK
jgi:hypothetical protein